MEVSRLLAAEHLQLEFDTVANAAITIRVDGRNSSGVVATASITVTVANGVPTATPTPAGNVVILSPATARRSRAR